MPAGAECNVIILPGRYLDSGVPGQRCGVGRLENVMITATDSGQQRRKFPGGVSSKIMLLAL